MEIPSLRLAHGSSQRQGIVVRAVELLPKAKDLTENAQRLIARRSKQ